MTEEKSAQNPIKPVVKPGAALVVALILITLAAGSGLFLYSTPFQFVLMDLKYKDAATAALLNQQGGAIVPGV